VGDLWKPQSESLNPVSILTLFYHNRHVILHRPTKLYPN